MTEKTTPPAAAASKPSLRTAALDADDLGGELVPVPEWGPQWVAWVRGVEAQERNEALRAATTVVQLGDGETKSVLNTDVYYARLVIAATLDPETKERVFAEDDLQRLLRKGAAAVDRLANVVLRLSGMTKSSVEEAVKEAGEE